MGCTSAVGPLSHQYRYQPLCFYVLVSNVPLPMKTLKIKLKINPNLRLYFCHLSSRIFSFAIRHGLIFSFSD